jgi:hypothetical protein
MAGTPLNHPEPAHNHDYPAFSSVDVAGATTEAKSDGAGCACMVGHLPLEAEPLNLGSVSEAPWPLIEET